MSIKKSKLSALNPFIDDRGILRVDGRLAFSNFSYDIKFPIILSCQFNFSCLFVRYVHKSNLHTGKSFVMNTIFSKVYVVGGLLKLVKKMLFKCVRYTKYKAETMQKLMGSLPPEQSLINIRPFTYIGVVLAGYCLVKCTNHRSYKINKLYAAFFVCFSTKAAHIEIVIDLSTDSFMHVFDRLRGVAGYQLKFTPIMVPILSVPRIQYQPKS